MYLKSISVKGFKSFPDRTRLEFGPGVSVIVGPNGSGKSNVTDAVLWALGEQSPVNVRGQSMQDVIFGGAPGRQAASAAEVELVLDDSEGALGLGVSEISILRRLDRSGEGEYRLAGARCRLVDVVELLSDTGLGKEMHSVISQGRVESLVTSKPRERRLLIEEAAGLGKHRKRRRRAQLKLARTQDNLDRALDVEREARSRLRPLKRQAEAAELHARLERQATEIRWELVRDAALRRGQEVTAAQAAVAAVRERRARLQAELAAVAKRRQAAEEALAARSAQREELSRRAYTARGAGERVGYRAESTRAAATQLEGRIGRSARVLETLRASAAADVPDPAAGERIAGLERELEALARDREAELARQLTALEADRETARASEAGARTVVAERLGAREQADALLQAARTAVREAEREVEAARREAARVGSELAGVNQFLRHQAGSPSGARALSDDLDVDAGYELALSAALDGRLRAAVVPDRGTGDTLLDRAGRDGGRALVLAGADESAPATGPAPPGGEPLIDHVRGPEPALALARTLLAGTWVVADLAAIPEGWHGVAVTTQGRVWSSQTRELRQAPAVGEERILAERNRREELVRATDAAAQTEQAAKQAVESAAGAAAQAGAQRDAAVEAHREAVRTLDEAAEAVRRITAQIERRRTAPDEGAHAGRRAQLTAELNAERATAERAERERRERAARIQRVQAALDADRTTLPLVLAVTEVLGAAQAAISARLADFEQALAADREAGEGVTGELRACGQEEARLQSALQSENEALTTAEVRSQRARDQDAETRAELTALAGRLELAPEPATEPLDDAARAELDGRLARVARRREQLGPVNPLAQDEYAEALAHVEELENQRADLENALRELEKLITDTDRQIRSTFEETFAATAKGFEELAGQLFPGGSGRLRLVSERPTTPARVIGGEDTAAADTGEADEPEVEESEEDLQGVEIEITPAGKDPKRLSLLSGGEKSMTALAFLFAVFLARPCPFYILDEVEAALDDLNIDRFLTLLREYSSRAQFIVVTHQKRTMDAADSLYGVSMASDGISKVISRRLTETAAVA
ncbi:MAG TPA: AAA family ATPase [Solirubrobacteraceae bacterium]|nr:AAA family ATPase [Solirubrobacteraceae bacterium]